MALSSIQIGRLGQAYAKKESTYGTVPSLTAAEAFRHKQLTFPGSDVKNKRVILEKKQSPFTMTQQMTDQRTTAGFNLQAILRPSGTINTVPEVDAFLECAFGAKTNVVLSTTVTTGTGAVGGATLASTTGLAVGGPVLITCPDGKKRIRFIATLPGANAVTWAPNLPAGQQPADGAAVKSGLLYKPTSSLALSLSIAHYLKNLDSSAGLARVLSGAGVDKLSLAFDANDDPMLTASGPGKLLDTAGAPAQPGGFTMVGSTPPSGILGELLLGNTAAKFLKMQVDLNNALKVRNESYGYTSAEEIYRAGRAEVDVTLDMRAESESVLYDLAEAGTNVPLFLQTGFTEGNCLAVRLANVLFAVPDTDDPDEEVNFPFKGKGLETSDAALDALVVAIC
jgi:hypothetical protein